LTNTALPDIAAEWNGRSKKTESGEATQNPSQEQMYNYANAEGSTCKEP
jgi:hypothetical protein